jgi:hypothetical protein
MRRRRPEPVLCLGVVLRDVYTGVVQEPEVELRGGVSLVRRQPVQAHGLGVVLRDTFSVVVHSPEEELRFSITGPSSHPQRIDLQRLRLARHVQQH